MTWLDMLRRRVDYMTGRYRAFVVEREQDRAAALALLEEVRRSELRRVVGSTVLQSAAFADVPVDDLLLACRDTRTGEIVGCVRSTLAESLAGAASSRDEYQLDLIPADLLARAGVATRLAVRRDVRKSAASLVLLETMYAEGLARGYALCLLACEPGLYTSYLRLGFRPLGRVRASAFGGFRIPMVMVNHDREYLAQVGSPLTGALQRSGRVDPAGVAWIRHLAAERGPIDIGVAAFRDAGAAVHRALTESVSEPGVASLLENAMMVDCGEGQVVLREGDGGRAMGFVANGLVEVRRDERTLAMLGEGELFGELALILDRPRTARVVAATDDTRVLLLSQNALDRLENPADLARVWQNLARHLARRLAP